MPAAKQKRAANQDHSHHSHLLLQHHICEEKMAELPFIGSSKMLLLIVLHDSLIVSH